MIFHRRVPAVICFFTFFLLIVWGLFKLIFWHSPRFFFFSKRDSNRFIKEVGKSADQLACACGFGGRHDETISNRAGRIFKEKEWHSPVWVIVVKKVTDKWEENHIETSIEPLRPDEDEIT
jgi:hypothetical protein